jgi:hypothetical protein
MDVQVAMRPIQLWEVVFPKEHFNSVYNTIMQDQADTPERWSKYQKYLTILRKALGAEKMPEIDIKAPVIPIPVDTHFNVLKGFRKVHTNNVHRIPIGVREDINNEAGDTELL